MQSILKQTPSMEKADWVFDNIKNICTMYHRNQCVSEQIIEMIPGNYLPFIHTIHKPKQFFSTFFRFCYFYPELRVNDG